MSGCAGRSAIAGSRTRWVMFVLVAGLAASVFSASGATLRAQGDDPVAAAEAERDLLLARAGELRAEIEALEAEVANPLIPTELLDLMDQLVDTERRVATAEARAEMVHRWVPLDVPSVLRSTVVGTYTLLGQGVTTCTRPDGCGEEWLPFTEFQIVAATTTGDHSLVTVTPPLEVDLEVSDVSVWLLTDLLEPRYYCDGVVGPEPGYVMMEIFPWVVVEADDGSPRVRNLWGVMRLSVPASDACDQVVMTFDVSAERTG